MPKETQLLVFTDLDGTLLDHESYSWEKARDAVQQLKKHRVPLIPVTSKTRAELRSLRVELNNVHPYVVENGAATYIPNHYFDDLDAYVTSHEEHCIASGPTRDALQEPIVRARDEHGFRFKSFTEMGSREIAWLTGLSPNDAELANDRSSTEPLLWQDSASRLADFVAFLASLGVSCVAGGRFVHVMGQFDKADAVARLVGLYAKKFPQAKLISVVLGDGPNDLKMLSYADIAVVIKGKHDHDMTLPTHDRVIRTTGYGPASWNDAVLNILRDHDLTTHS